MAAGFAAVLFFTTVVNFATIGGLAKLEFCQDVTRSNAIPTHIWNLANDTNCHSNSMHAGYMQG